MNRSFHVENHDGTRRFLEWRPRGNVEIERAGRYSGNYQTIATLQNARQYVDEPTSRSSPRAQYYYRIRPAQEAETGSEEGGAPVLGPKAAEPRADKRTLYIRRQARRHLRRVGQKSYLFEEERKATERCPDCWDPVRQVQTRSNCENCDGSGYVEGWPDPVEVNISYGPGEPLPEQTRGGKLDTNQLQCWAASIPRFSLGDLVVREKDREVFEVVQHQHTLRSGHRLRQNVILKLVERGSSARSVGAEVPA
jgi:hypothetical protein